MRTRNSIISFFVILLCSFTSFGAYISWKANTTGDWNVATNWVGGVVPGLGDYAMLSPGAGYTVTVNSNETLQGVRVITGTLQILSGAILNLTQGTSFPCIWHQGILNNYGTINISSGTASGIQCQGTIVNDGSININSIAKQGIDFISGTISNSGQLFINGLPTTGIGYGIVVSGTSFTNTGSITIGNTAALAEKGIVVNSGKQFINSGSIIIDNCGNIGLQNIGTFTNSSGANIEIGMVSHCNHRGIDNSGTFTNSLGASIEIDDVQNEAIYNTSGTFTNSGSFIQQATTFWAIRGASGTILNETTGQIWSGKTIEGNFFNNKGTLNPGNSPGILQINNSFVNSASSNFNIEIGGTIAGTDYDQVNFQNAGNNANISNTALNVSYISGYAPVGGESFDIIIGNGFVGTFNSIVRPAPPAGFAWNDVYTATTFTMSLTAVAPLDLIEFQVKLDADQVLLNWLTVNESDMRGFEIERSYDLNNWENIKFVEAVNKLSENKYYCQDKPAIQKMVYYRLKIISNDGQYKYSEIRSLQLENKREINVYPNPVSGKLFLDINEPINKIRVFDIIGNQYSIKFDSNTIDTESLISGVYLLFIDDLKPIIFVKKG